MNPESARFWPVFATICGQNVKQIEKNHLTPQPKGSQMRKLRLMIGCALVALTAACGGGDMATRSSSSPVPVLGPPGAAAVALDYAVKDVQVTVPEHLKVSEANMYYPIADIVWRGEARGGSLRASRCADDRGIQTRHGGG